MSITNARAEQTVTPPILRFPHVCWEPLYSVPPLRTSMHSLYDHHFQSRTTPHSKTTKGLCMPPKRQQSQQVRDADALVLATLPSRHLLQQVRQRTGLQQTQLAHIISVPWTDIRDLESGNRPVSLAVLEKVSRALDTQLSYNSAVDKERTLV